jgi:hypothetical protein
MDTSNREYAVLTSVARGLWAKIAFEKILRTRGKVVWTMTLEYVQLLAQLKVLRCVPYYGYTHGGSCAVVTA